MDASKKGGHDIQESVPVPQSDAPVTESSPSGDMNA